jgi:hypothetical protein
MPLTRSAVLAGSSKEERLAVSAANKKQKLDQRICLDTNNTDIKIVLLSEIRNHVDDDKPGPTCIGGDHQTACNQANTVQTPNDPLIEVAPMLPLPPLPINTPVLPPPVPSKSVLPVTSVPSSLLRPVFVLPSHRIMVIVNGDLDIFPLCFSMCRADCFTKLLCKISTICSMECGCIDTVPHAYTLEHNGFQLSTKDTPVSLGYGAVAPSANVRLTFKINPLSI